MHVHVHVVSFCFNVCQQRVITDAQRDSTANAFHTTVPCLSGKVIVLVSANVHVDGHINTEWILACSTVSQKEYSTAQMREFECTKAVLPKVIEEGNTDMWITMCHKVMAKLKSERCGGSTYEFRRCKSSVTYFMTCFWLSWHVAWNLWSSWI